MLGGLKSQPVPKMLREIMQMSLIEREGKDKIASLWMEYHAQKPQNVSYCLSKGEWDIFKQNSQESQLSLYPLKRKQGHMMMIAQAQKNSILYGYLEDYQRSATFSHPYLILTTFDELLFSKSIILVRGDIMDYRLNRDEAYFLMNQTLRFYMDPHLYSKYVQTLNRNQGEFDYEQFRGEFKIN